MEDEYAIGLDLGTTFSCIGVYRNGGVEIIPNRNGEKTTPSIVIITNEGKILVGEETTDYLVKNYDSCIYEVKRLIGREFSDENLQKEKEKLPFKIIKSIKGDFPEIEVEIKGEKKNYTPVEILSLIIKKMVKNAEKYLNKNVTKLVITVPAYFNNSQKELTKQAAELIHLKVLRIINEPIAAALSYGFEIRQEVNEKILIFDLGGGTFDVSILNLNGNSNNSNDISFQVLGISGDNHLGGEDFDNELVDYFLEKRKEDEKNIRNDKKAMKRLKVACENIKKILSSAENTTLRINNFYNNEDINEPITRTDFEDKCKKLFKKLEDSLDTALKNSKLEKKDINEIILVGGSTRIPKVKEIIKNYFINCKINDIINPDEAVAYGATLAAEKILYNKDDTIRNFHLLDITPFSLGTNVINNSTDSEIKKEGNLMSVIIKRGTPVPTFNTIDYCTVKDNQTVMSINIYEGDKRYVKYNHLLRKCKITGLTPRPKGKTKVFVTFEIDINGILSIKAKEESKDNKGQTLDLQIKNDDVVLKKEELEKIQKKNDELLKQINNNELISKIDYSNLKDALKKYKDAYNNCKNNKNDNDDEEDERRIIYIKNFNETLEEFIDLFDKNFDNETVLEKYYLYIKELFLSYIETLSLAIDKGDKDNIMLNIKKYIEIFINKSSGYLNNLLEILSDLSKKKNFKIFFYEIIIFTLEKLNECGKECLKSGRKFCKYNSLMYFEQAKTYYQKYLSNIDENLLKIDKMNSLKKQKDTFSEYIRDINCGAIVLIEESFKGGRLIPEEITGSGTLRTNDLRRYALGNINNNIERCKIVLANYENVLASIQLTNNPTKKEAICIANIIKLNKILGRTEKINKTLISLAERCFMIIEHIQVDKNEEWYKEFIEIYNKEIEKKLSKNVIEDQFKAIKESNKKLFDEIDSIFNKKTNMEFIHFILEKHPYNNYKNDNNRNFNNCTPELLSFLMMKYQPDDYKSSDKKDKESQLKYCIANDIFKKLSNISSNIQ